MKIYSKTYGRLIAIQVIYQFYFFEFTRDVNELLEYTLNFYLDGNTIHDIEINASDLDAKFAKKLICSTIENKDKVDLLLESLLASCTYVPENIIYSVLRVGIIELAFFNTANKVVLSEFGNLAASLVPANKVGVVCAVLDKISKMSQEERNF
jgi:transcription termination factor NusB